MSNNSSMMAVDRGTLRLRLDIDLTTLAVAVLFVTVAILGVAVLSSGGLARNAIEVLTFTT
jgi:hypothetical protein